MDAAKRIDKVQNECGVIGSVVEELKFGLMEVIPFLLFWLFSLSGMLSMGIWHRIQQNNKLFGCSRGNYRAVKFSLDNKVKSLLIITGASLGWMKFVGMCARLPSLWVVLNWPKKWSKPVIPYDGILCLLPVYT